MRHETRNFYEYRGQRLGIKQLAGLAGCSYCTMRQRLLRNQDPEACVAMGVTAPTNNQVWSRKRVLHDYQGRKITSKQLADLAGMNLKTMRARLRRMSPEDAVNKPLRKEKAKAAKARKPRKPQGKIHDFRGQQLTLRQIAEAPSICTRLRGHHSAERAHHPRREAARPLRRR